MITPELLEARRLIEVELARLAAERRTDEDLTAMQDVLDRHRARLDELKRPIVEASQFHLLVADAAKNRVLSSIVRPFFRLAFELGPQLYQTAEGYAHWELDQHTRIRDAIASGDGELARLRMLERDVGMSMDPPLSRGQVERRHLVGREVRSPDTTPREPDLARLLVSGSTSNYRCAGCGDRQGPSWLGR